MPGMNGFELARRLRAAGSTARLVFLTVHDEEELILAAGNAGAIGDVLKSRLSADLVVAVCEARAGRPFQSRLDTENTSPATITRSHGGISVRTLGISMRMPPILASGVPLGRRGRRQPPRM